MAGSTPSPATRTTTITDLNEDAISQCATYLTVRDVCNMAMTSTELKRLAYSDSVWHRFLPERWLQQLPPSGTGTGGRELYLARRKAVQQFKFRDPVRLDYCASAPFNHLLLHENHVFFTQGSVAKMMNLDDYQKGVEDFLQVMRGHTARITCMRLFSQGEQNVLVTSSPDRSIRLWLKGSYPQCWTGHSGPVLSLSNKLLGEDGSKVLASGGADRTVRLWSLNSSVEQEQHALKATLQGHKKPVKLISVSGHKTSHLVTISTDSEVRVWDTATSSADSSSCCVGMTSVSGPPVNMKCHESLLYVAAGSSVTAFDLRTMQKVITLAVHRYELYSFDAVPSKSLLCTGGYTSAKLWDIRRNQELLQPEPIAELDGHYGCVDKLYMDPYKIVTGSYSDSHVNVWEVGTGEQTNSLLCCLTEEDVSKSGCNAMAVDGCRIITSSYCRDEGVLRFWDFNNATTPVTKLENEPPSGFGDSLD